MTAHADICSRLEEVSRAERQVADCCDCRPEDTANWKYMQTCKEAAALIQQMAGELAKSQVCVCDDLTISDLSKLSEYKKHAESAESQLADLRAKLAAADAGMPSEPKQESNGMWIASFGKCLDPLTAWHHYATELRTLATTQAVRITDIVHELKLIEEHHVYLNQKAGRRESNSHTLKLVRAALQLAAKHD